MKNEGLDKSSRKDIKKQIRKLDRSNNSLLGTTNDIIDLGNDQQNTYDLTSGDASDGEHSVSLDDDGVINIEGGNNNAEHIHELTHAALPLRANDGNHVFNERGNLTTTGSNQIVHERKAYTAQFFYDSRSLPRTSQLTISDYRQIGLPYIASIKSSSGKPVYERASAQWEKLSRKQRSKIMRETKNLGKN